MHRYSFRIACDSLWNRGVSGTLAANIHRLRDSAIEVLADEVIVTVEREDLGAARVELLGWCKEAGYPYLLPKLIDTGPCEPR